MWQARYTGPSDRVTVLTTEICDTWKAAHEHVVVMIKTVAPVGTYATLITEASHAKRDADWSTTDSVHTFSVRQVEAHSAALAAAHVEFQDDPAALLDGDAPTPAHIGSGITHCPPAEITVLPDVDMRAEAAAWIADHREIIAGALAEPVDHSAREHSELGGSIAKRFMNCRASVRLVRGLPNPETLASKRGTAAHEVAHMCLANSQDAIEYIGRTVNDIEIDEPIADGVQAYLDDCRECPATERYYEVRFNLESLGPPAPMFGTSDFVAYDALEQRLYVKDYKNGFKYVGAVGNEQLRYYALGAVLWLGNDKPVSEICVTICQPNGGSTTLKTDTFDALELIEWSHDLMAAAHETQDPNAPAVAGPWCDDTFCPARGSCAARAVQLLTEAQIEFDDLEQPMRTPEVRLLTPAELGAIHGAASGLIAFLEAVAERIKADTAGTGWKVVATRPTTVWLDEEAAALALQLEHGIADPFTHEIISPAVARGLLKDSLYAERVSQHATGKKPTKKAAEEDARALLGDLLTKRSGGTKLVPEADPSPAVPTNGSEFDELDT